MPAMPRRVLVVDDDPHIRQLLAFAFAKAGMEVSEAGDGEEALASAARAMPDLAVTALREGRMIAIALADDGPGVAPGDAPRIFDPFFTSKRESGGTGLGLPIARALSESCGGALELTESQVGSRFILRVPAVS